MTFSLSHAMSQRGSSTGAFTIRMTGETNRRQTLSSGDAGPAWPGYGTTVTVRGAPVCLLQRGWDRCAIDETRPHAGVSSPGGRLRGTSSGVAPTASGTTSRRATRCMIRRSRVTRYPVQVVEGTILVDVT